MPKNTVTPLPPVTMDFGVHWVVATLCFLSQVCIMVSRSTQFVPCSLWNQRPSVQGVIIPCHQPHVPFDFFHTTHACAVTLYYSGRFHQKQYGGGSLRTRRPEGPGGERGDGTVAVGGEV